MDKSYDLLFLAAHPDDVEFGMGGTFLRLCRKYRCMHAILTKGEAGTFGSPEQRVEEAKAAARFAGCSVVFLGFKDNHIEDNAETAKRLAEVIRRYRPKVVFAPYHGIAPAFRDGASHPDHINLGRAVVKAARFAKFKNAEVPGEAHLIGKLIYFMVPKASHPSFYVDVSDVAEDIKRLWSHHKSQMNLADGKVTDRLMLWREAQGRAHGVGYAEYFISDELIKIDPERLLE